jgi:hypothetical protein
VLQKANSQLSKLRYIMKLMAELRYILNWLIMTSKFNSTKLTELSV